MPYWADSLKKYIEKKKEEASKKECIIEVAEVIVDLTLDEIKES